MASKQFRLPKFESKIVLISFNNILTVFFCRMPLKIQITSLEKKWTTHITMMNDNKLVTSPFDDVISSSIDGLV